MTVLATDTFTDTQGVLLQAHTMNLGGAWTKHPTATSDVEITSANRARNNGTTGVGLYHIGQVQSGADYTVSCDVHRLSFVNTAAEGPCGRMDDTAATFYHLRYNAGSSQIQLYRSVAGTLALLDSSSTTGIISDGVTATLTLEMVGDQITGKRTISGTTVTVVGPITDANITAAGRAGVRIGGAAQGDTTGVHIDNFSVDGTSGLSNVTPPVVSGTRVVGFQLSTTNGTWSSTGTFTYQWQRDAVNISGATANTYTQDVADVGHAISCVVTNTVAGTPVSASSNSLTTLAAMAAGDVQFLKSGSSGIGGAPGAVVASASDVFDSVLNAEAVAGDTEYRLVYVRNNHAIQNLADPVVWVQSQTSSAGTDIALGVATESAGANVTAVANEGTAPAGVTFSAPASSGAGEPLGDIAAGSFKGLWLRRTVTAGASPTGADTATIGWQGTPE